MNLRSVGVVLLLVVCVSPIAAVMLVTQRIDEPDVSLVDEPDVSAPAPLRWVEPDPVDPWPTQEEIAQVIALCTVVGDISDRIFEYRYGGVALTDVLARFGSADGGEFTDDARQIAIEIYGLPRRASQTGRREQADEYRARLEITCLQQNGIGP